MGGTEEADVRQTSFTYTHHRRTFFRPARLHPVADRARLLAGDSASSETLQDHACALARR